MTNTRKTPSRHGLMVAGFAVAVAIAIGIGVHAISVARIIGHSGSALPILIPIGMMAFLLVEHRD